jgi:DNA helicase INO80
LYHNNPSRRFNIYTRVHGHALTLQVQDIVVGTKSLTDVAKPSEIVSLFMDDEELAESVAKRKQAESHGYTAPSIVPVKTSKFGDNLGGGGGDEDEDDFFSLKKKVVNGEEEDEPSTTAPAEVGGEGKKKSKRKAEGERECSNLLQIYLNSLVGP